METPANKGFVYEFGNFVLDPTEKTLFVDGVAIHLPAKEFDTLLLLIEHNGHSLSKDEMMSSIWQDAFVEESNLVKQISRLRKIFNTNGNNFIETIPKHGYRFSADVRLAQTVDEPVILEKRTVKRLTVSVGNEVEPEPLALPASNRRGFRRLVLALAFVAIIGLGYLAWNAGTDEPKVIDPYEPVRLTDSLYHDTAPTWSRDGRIRFSRIYSKDRYVTFTMNADGSDQTELATVDGRRIFSWSPDEQKVLFQKQVDTTKTYLSNADGTGEILLPFRGGTWSPDSKMLAYRAQVVEHNHDIFVYSLETGESRNVTNHEDFAADPSFSPDSKSILFTSNRDGNNEIYSIDLDGNNLRRLTFHPDTDIHASYSPDGTTILFNSERENENVDVYVIRADGTGAPIKITNWDKSNETAEPGCWSPDGTKIVFFSDRNGKDDIYVMSAEWIRPKLVLSDRDHDIGSFSLSPDGNKIAFGIKLEDNSGELRTFDRESGWTTFLRKIELPVVPLAWSPDGNKFLFHDRIDGNAEVCIIFSDGSGFENLTNNPSRDTMPTWSPDGEHIVFVTNRGESPNFTRLYSMNANGSDPRPITPRKGWESEPVWAPDGSVIFSCDRLDIPGNLMDICQIVADGSGEKRILSHRNFDSNPTLSPDGNRIAFTALADGNAEIYVMNRDGSGLLRLTRHPADDQSPKWTPDGKKLLFLSNRTGRSELFEMEF